MTQQITKGDKILHNGKEGVVIHDYGNGQIEVKCDLHVELLYKNEVVKR